MKNIRLTILFAWFSILTANAQINDALSFSINDLEIDTVEGYLKLSMPECSHIDTIGYPELPRLEVRYVIPYDKTVSNVVLSDSIVQLLQGEYLIFPHQPSVRIGDAPSFFVQSDSTIYNSSLPYPRKVIEAVDDYYEYGYHIALFYVYPIVYYPQQRTLRFYSSLSYSISLTDYGNVIQQPEKEPERLSEIVKSLLKSKIRNVNA